MDLEHLSGKPAVNSQPAIRAVQASQCVRVGNAILFLTRSGRRLRENAYVLTEDTYAAPDLTLLSDHLTETVRLNGTVTNRAIVDMAYQREPISTVWAVRADGVLLGMTYLRDQNLVGWHRHVTGTPGSEPPRIPVASSFAASKRCA